MLQFVALVDLLKNTFGGHIFFVKILHVSIFERLKAWNQLREFLDWIEYIDKGFSKWVAPVFPPRQIQLQVFKRGGQGQGLRGRVAWGLKSAMQVGQPVVQV